MLDNKKLLESAYKSANLDLAERVIQYLDCLNTKCYSNQHIRKHIFQTKWISKQEGNVFRCHIQAASVYLKYLVAHHEKIEFANQFKIVIADIIPYVQLIDKEQDTSHFLLSTNTLPAFIHYLNAQELFYKHSIRNDCRDNYRCDVLVLYALRLSLEKRIKGIIGIDYAIDSKQNPISLTKLIRIIKEIKNIEFSKEIDWCQIEQVNGWLNHFIHRGLRPHPWVIHQAFEVLDNLIMSKSRIINDRTHYSWYGSAFVKSKTKFKEEIETVFLEKYPGGGIKWASQWEVLSLDV